MSDGDYHYHVAPTCMMDAMNNAGDDAIIGWAFDGFPLFGNDNPDGTPITDQTLDVCNGQADETFGYRYHTSQEAPYIIQCLMGEVVDFDDSTWTPAVEHSERAVSPKDGYDLVQWDSRSKLTDCENYNTRIAKIVR